MHYAFECSQQNSSHTQKNRLSEIAREKGERGGGGGGERKRENIDDKIPFIPHMNWTQIYS